MIDLGNPLVTLKITSAVCSFVAVVTTIHRLWIRRGRYWIDDGWAFFSFLCLLVQIAAVFMHVDDPSDLSRTNRVAAYYLMALTFYAVIWGSRQAILYSVIRIDPNPQTRKILYIVSGVFGVTTIVLMVQLFWVCEPEPHWKDMASPQCTLNKEVAICQLVSDIIADLTLLIAPIRLIKSLDDKVLRRKLTVIFSTCIITTIVSLVHAAYILQVAGVKVVISAIVEDSVSLIVANIPVVVTQIIRLRDDAIIRRREKDAPSTFIRFASKIMGNKSRNGGKSTLFSSLFGGARTTTATREGGLWTRATKTNKAGDEELGNGNTMTTTMTTNPSMSFGMNSMGLGVVDLAKSRASRHEEALITLPHHTGTHEEKEMGKDGDSEKERKREVTFQVGLAQSRSRPSRDEDKEKDGSV